MECRNGREAKRQLICIAGKNDIAVSVLDYLLKKKKTDDTYELCITCNKTESGKNSWQRSLRYFAKQKGVKELEISDLYNVENLLFISTEYDRLIKPDRFMSKRLFNLHFSLLPAYKGMFTSAMVLLKGEKYTGVTFHRIDAGIDTGEIIAQRRIELSDEDTCRDVYLKLIKWGTSLLIENLDVVINRQEISAPQKTDGSSYYSNNVINYNNVEIDLNQTADNIKNQIRAFNFREYQLPVVYDRKICGIRITDIRSKRKPGEKIFETENGFLINTIDYDIFLYFDKLDELLEACRNDDVQTVSSLLCTPGLINAAEVVNGWTPLMVSTYNNSKECVRYLIAAGADIKAKNHNGTNMLMYAKDVFINYKDDYLYRLFLKLGLSPDVKDYEGKTTYDYCMKIPNLVNTMKDIYNEEVLH